MEGMASIALLPDGSISGHFVRLPHSVCYGIHGTGIFLCWSWLELYSHYLCNPFARSLLKIFFF
ncbi:hypothetical protein HanPI659440_Chr00c04g0711891 [Helianthus annuus]|nr:hypothetical protein HanPI659440_Chr00c04g0711891 [Helianthus annuus]